MSNSKLIEGLSEKSLKDLATMRLSANAKNNSDGYALVKAIDKQLISRAKILDGWTPGTQEVPRIFMKDGNKVAVVYRIETHGSSKGGYAIEVDGVTIGEFRTYIEDAKTLAEAIIAAKMS